MNLVLSNYPCTRGVSVFRFSMTTLTFSGSRLVPISIITNALLNSETHKLMNKTSVNKKKIKLTFFTGYAYRGTIVESALTPSCRKKLLEHRIVHDSDLGYLVHVEGDGYARVRHGVHEVHGTVDRVDYPRRGVRELDPVIRLRRPLLADESVSVIKNVE